MPPDDPTPQSAPDAAAAEATPLASPSPSAPGVDSAAEPKPAKAKDLAALEHQKFQLREERRRLRGEAEQHKTAVETERKAREAAEKRIADLEAIVGRIKSGEALHVAAEMGADPNKTLETYLQASAPEAQTRALADKIARLEKQREDDARRATEAHQEQQRQFMAAAEKAAIASFVKSITDNATKYPAMYEVWEDDEIAAQAHKIQEWAKTVEWIDEQGVTRRGRTYPFAEVADFLEKQAKMIQDRRAERRSKVLGAPVEQNGSGTAKPASTEGQRSRSVPKQAAKPKVLTREEEEAEDLAALRAAMARDAAFRAQEDAKSQKKH